MMAPKYERVRALAEAIEVGAGALDDPIDMVSVTGNRIFVSAGGKRLELSYAYNNAYSADGSSMPGSGRWSASIVGSVKQNRFAAAVRAILRRD